MAHGPASVGTRAPVESSIMIEFKADCGHTVRAKDQDAGNVVRCSYCGTMVSVPQEQADDLDFFFQEVDRAADQSGVAAAVHPRRKVRKGAPRTRKPKREFDPFSLALKMCYAAALIIAVWVVGKMFVWPALTKQPDPPVVQSDPEDGRRPIRRRGPRGDAPAESSRKGLASLSGDWGLYVSSVPPGAKVYVAPASDLKSGARVADLSGCRNGVANMTLGQGQLTAGRYAVEVVHLWNDPQLKQFPEYRTFRRRMEEAGLGKKPDEEKAMKERRALMAEYFLPDEATNVMIVQGRDSEYYLVRQYANVDVREGQWAEVRALFLPRVGGGEGAGSFSLEHVRPYVPKEVNYSFDETFVKDELEYYGVAPTDVVFAMDVLKWQGVVPYPTPSRGLRLFKIRIDDGAFIAADITDLAGK